jgi:crotonobetainyl-CoA:carnitine CoA-transferase CaiB-like acyl-CoA transferase
VNGPVNFSGVACQTGARVPSLGEHTEEVLKELSD